MNETIYRLRVEAREVNGHKRPEIDLTLDVPADGLHQAQIRARAMASVIGYEILVFRSQMPTFMANENALSAVALKITAAIAVHDEGLAAVIDSKHLVRQIFPLFAGFPSEDETPAPLQTLLANLGQHRKDLHWRIVTSEDGPLGWSGYDDANWWENVSKTDAARNRVGKVTGRLYRLDHTTGAVEVFAPKAEG